MQKRGFSILELFIAIMLFIVIVGGLFSMVIPTIDSFQLGNAQIDLEAHIRGALDFMTSELRQTRILKIIDGPILADDFDYNVIKFSIPYDIDDDGDIIDDSSSSRETIEWSDQDIPINWTVQYQLVGNQIIRTAGDGQNPVLANHISALTFRRPSMEPNTIEISISAQKSSFRNRSVQISLSSKIKMRN